MDTIDIIRTIGEAVLSSGLIASLFTLRTTKRKAEEELQEIKATNADSILRTNEEYIVKPLKREINGLRTTVRQLTKVIQKAQECPHAGDCPVRNEMLDVSTNN
ncbi:MAG: hypothetical protein E7069_03560 [Bacteroidales bacterium]|nr:hypothetical protein [Bacteroidales bacterium]